MHSVSARTAGNHDFIVPLSHPCWDLLHNISKGYSNRVLPRTNAQHFHENRWAIENGLDNPAIFDFIDYKLPDGSSLGEDSNFGLQLFLKVRTFHLLQKESEHTGEEYAPRTILSRFRNTRATLLPLLKSHNILCADPFSKQLRSIDNLTPSLIEPLLDEIIQSDKKRSSKWIILNGLKLYLEDDLTIPKSFRPAFGLFSSTAYDLLSILDDDTEGYEPIPEGDFYWIGKSALEFVNCYAEDIIRLHELMVAVWKMDPPGSYKIACDNSLHHRVGNAVANFITIPFRVRELLRQMEESGLALPRFSNEHHRAWNVEEFQMPSSDTPSYLLANSGGITTYCYFLFDLLFGALCSLVLIPTGLRNSELRCADIDRLSKTANQDGVFSYINANIKGKSCSTFFAPNEIPIPVEVWRAFKLMARLSAPLRDNDSHMICIRPLNHMYSRTFNKVDKYGTIVSIQSKDDMKISLESGTARAIAKFSQFIRSSTIPSPHQFRKSLAEFMLRKTSMAPLLICQLFGHNSIQMTLKYLKRSHLIRRELRNYSAERFREGALVVAIAISRDAAAGHMFDRIRNVVSSRAEFQGLTEPEFELSLARWLMNRVVSQQLVILHTPLSLCCRSTTAKDKTPCQNNALGPFDSDLPDPSNCAGIKCSWALTTFEQAADLGAALVFYKNILDTANHDLLSKTHLLSYAADFVETYNPIVERIKKVPIDDIRSSIESLKSKLAGSAA